VTALAAFAFLALMLTNRAIGRSMLYPPAVFSAAWAGYLVGLLLLGDRFFPLSAETLAVFLVGGLCLSLGGLAVSLRRRGTTSRPTPVVRSVRALDRLLTLGLWVCVLGLPLSFLRLKALAASRGATNILTPYFWGSVRRASILEAERNQFSLVGLTDNFGLLAGLLALASVAEDAARGRFGRRTAVLVGLAIAYQVMSAGRASAFILLLGLVAISWLASGRVPRRVLAIVVGCGVLIFSFLGIVLGKGGSAWASAGQNVEGMIDSIELYSLGGLVAFDHTVREPDDIPPAWSVTRSFVQVANKLGAHIDVPSNVALFVQVSNRDVTNVYTMYFAYFPELGWGGVATLTFILGVILTWLFWAARAGDPRARLLYAACFAGLILSSFSEYFFMNLNYFTKATVFSLILYGLPALRWFPHVGRERLPAPAEQEAPPERAVSG
jgi:oligosaccharide repeat unit polymerase